MLRAAVARVSEEARAASARVNEAELESMLRDSKIARRDVLLRHAAKQWRLAQVRTLFQAWTAKVAFRVRAQNAITRVIARSVHRQLAWSWNTLHAAVALAHDATVDATRREALLRRVTRRWRRFELRRWFRSWRSVCAQRRRVWRSLVHMVRSARQRNISRGWRGWRDFSDSERIRTAQQRFTTDTVECDAVGVADVGQREVRRRFRHALLLRFWCTQSSALRRGRCSRSFHRWYVHTVRARRGEVSAPQIGSQQARVPRRIVLMTPTQTSPSAERAWASGRERTGEVVVGADSEMYSSSPFADVGNIALDDYSHRVKTLRLRIQARSPAQPQSFLPIGAGSPGALKRIDALLVSPAPVRAHRSGGG